MSQQDWYRLGFPVVDLYAGLMLKMNVEYHAPLPEGPKIIAANHPSTTDPFLITTLTSEQVSIVIDERLFKVPVFGHYLQKAGHIPVIASNARAAFDKARRLLEAGRTIAIFPEGAISPPGGGFHKPRTGTARLALSTGAPVVPVGIHLDHRRIRLIETLVEGKVAVGTWYLRGPYAMTVGKPMYFRGDVEHHEYVREVSARIIQRIAYLSQASAYRMTLPPSRLFAEATTLSTQH